MKLFIEAFNDELEQLYNDINFPNHEDALRAVSKDLESTMYQRQELRKENAYVNFCLDLKACTFPTRFDILGNYGRKWPWPTSEIKSQYW